MDYQTAAYEYIRQLDYILEFKKLSFVEAAKIRKTIELLRKYYFETTLTSDHLPLRAAEIILKRNSK